MPYTITDIAGCNNTQSQTIYFDTAADFSAFDVSTVEPSSTALILATGDVYILNSQHIWVQQ